METVPREVNQTATSIHNKPEINEDINSNEFFIVNNLIIPNEEITAQILKRLHQLQQVITNYIYSKLSIILL